MTRKKARERVEDMLLAEGVYIGRRMTDVVASGTYIRVDRALDIIQRNRKGDNMAPIIPTGRGVVLLAWGKRVSDEFRDRIISIARYLQTEPSWLMASIAFETGGTFLPAIRNGAGSGAVGLIQFMPSTAFMLGTTTDELENMSAVEQLTFVERYFAPRRGRLNSLSDVYMAILWPAAIGKDEDHVLFDKKSTTFPKAYVQNAGLDLDKNGRITKAEATAKVQSYLERGLTPQNAVQIFI